MIKKAYIAVFISLINFNSFGSEVKSSKIEKIYKENNHIAYRKILSDKSTTMASGLVTNRSVIEVHKLKKDNKPWEYEAYSYIEYSDDQRDYYGYCNQIIKKKMICHMHYKEEQHTIKQFFDTIENEYKADNSIGYHD